MTTVFTHFYLYKYIIMYMIIYTVSYSFFHFFQICHRLFSDGVSTGYTDSLYMTFNVFRQGQCGNTHKSIHGAERVVHFNAHTTVSCLAGKKCAVAQVAPARAKMHHYRYEVIRN